MTVWKEYLDGHADRELVEFLEFEWPIHVYRADKPSVPQYFGDIQQYIQVKMDILYFPASSLMTRPKKDSSHRRVKMDLSWPRGISTDNGMNLDGPVTIRLPTTDCKVERLLQLGAGAYMYKTSLAREYRQLCVDPWDWPLLCFRHGGQCNMDLGPLPGIKNAAMCMQRTS